MVEIVALAGPLADTGEHGVTTVGLGHVVDQLHDKHGLADAGAAEQADLASLHVGGEQVDDLDASHENLLLDAHLDELGRLGVDGQPLGGVDRAPLVDGIADHVDDPAERLLADGNPDGGAGVDDLLSADETLSTVHGDRAHRVLSQVLGNLQDQPGLAASDVEGVEDLGQSLVELDVDDGTDDGENLAIVHLGLSGGGVLLDA